MMVSSRFVRPTASGMPSLNSNIALIGMSHNNQTGKGLLVVKSAHLIALDGVVDSLWAMVSGQAAGVATDRFYCPLLAALLRHHAHQECPVIPLCPPAAGPLREEHWSRNFGVGKPKMALLGFPNRPPFFLKFANPLLGVHYRLLPRSFSNTNAVGTSCTASVAGTSCSKKDG